MKDIVLFKSKEYAHSGHNFCELRILEDGDLRLWIHDGGTNCLICMDRDDLLELAKQLNKHGSTAPEKHESVDIFVRNKKTRPEPEKKKRKPKLKLSMERKAKKKETLDNNLNIDELKAKKIQEAMEN